MVDDWFEGHPAGSPEYRWWTPEHFVPNIDEVLARTEREASRF